MNRESHTTTEQHLGRYKKGVGTYEEKMPAFSRTYNEFTDQCFKDGALSKKQKHLMALGMSVYAQDEYCIIYHSKGCVDHGASEEEMLETIAVATAFGSGAAFSQGATLVQEAFGEFSKGLQ
ncbi:carboxymuconolactone decarboxylase family protein [Shouchella clausii]|jgi:AhpD family alkylhydroperoxidase|uniref:carboxymuconolactone decarboxylase family protein n=1 Tax=Shouchella clausii TaxID=79880 RepID=UPI000B97BEBD|nr:carboxymuconolactone decarboxylase family protein [Shouchella clausii]SPT80753.1 alkylhydroperoxidase like protein [Niallia circulans]AST96811.1 alkylhydroperoxidase [Shouchella clausii]MCM3547703.1 carboxymuconolactone decarboxylase family protein [Shouchella clausii]MCR1287248.1 carboxymuconolactone decarboxylase family protein [Shouchella clausii]MEB5471606.1 carboxymuconolactone decarboxylase family protein [Shouchella clausii]